MSNTSDLGDHMKELGVQAKTAASKAAAAKADSIKSAAAQKVRTAADAAEEAAAEEFDPATAQAQAMQQVSDQIADLASQLRDVDVRALAGQATAMARRNPALFIGGAAIAGFAAARFLKTRDPDDSPSQAQDPWQTPPVSSRGYRDEHVDTRSTMADINGGRSDGQS